MPYRRVYLGVRMLCLIILFLRLFFYPCSIPEYIVFRSVRSSRTACGGGESAPTMVTAKYGCDGLVVETRQRDTKFVRLPRSMNPSRRGRRCGFSARSRGMCENGALETSIDRCGIAAT